MRASEMKKGQTVRIDGKLYAIVDYQHVKLGKGGAVYQTKLKSLTDGSIQNVRPVSYTHLTLPTSDLV